MTWSRRAIIAAAGAGVAAASGCANTSERRNKLGIQLYMLGPDAAADLPASFRAVADIGFQEIELPARSGPALHTMRRALSDTSLECPSIHTLARPFPPDALSLEDMPGVIEAAHTLRAGYVVLSFIPLPTIPTFPPGEDPRIILHRATRAVTRDQWARVAADLSAKGGELARAGLRLAYHNHSLEFIRLGDETILDFLLANIDPALMDLELDLGWVAAAGLDPAALISRYADRVKLLHVKDVAEMTPSTGLEISPVDVGAGQIDWGPVLDAAKRARVRHYFVEQEPPYTRPPIDSARTAFAFLRPLL